MAKRYVDSNKYADPWFRQLSPKAKLFWDYILCNCDHAGIWKPDLGLASFCVGFQYNEEILDELNGRIDVLDNGRWFIPKFIMFQYPQGLNSANTVHRSVLNLLSSNNIEYPLKTCTKVDIDPSKGHQRHSLMSKDKDKDKDKVKDTIASSFELLWVRYPKKLGKSDAERHYKVSVRTEADLLRINKALNNYLAHAEHKEPEFVMHGSTWFNKWQDWVDYQEPMTPAERKSVAETSRKAEDFARHNT